MNTDGAKENVGEKPGYIYEISAELGNQKNFSIRGNFPVNAGKKQIDDELDKLVRSIGRQQAKACIPIEDAKLRQMERSLARMLKSSEVDQLKYKGHKSLPQVAIAEQENAATNIAEQRIQIQEQKVRLEELKKEAE